MKYNSSFLVSIKAFHSSFYKVSKNLYIFSTYAYNRFLCNNYPYRNSSIKPTTRVFLRNWNVNNKKSAFILNIYTRAFLLIKCCFHVALIYVVSEPYGFYFLWGRTNHIYPCAIFHFIYLASHIIYSFKNSKHQRTPS